MNLKYLIRRWDRTALTQLCEISSRLAAENDDLRKRLERADECADFWREQALDMQLQLADALDAKRGIMQTGELVIVR